MGPFYIQAWAGEFLPLASHSARVFLLGGVLGKSERFLRSILGVILFLDLYPSERTGERKLISFSESLSRTLRPLSPGVIFSIPQGVSQRSKMAFYLFHFLCFVVDAQ